MVLNPPSSTGPPLCPLLPSLIPPEAVAQQEEDRPRKAAAIRVVLTRPRHRRAGLPMVLVRGRCVEDRKCRSVRCRRAEDKDGGRRRGKEGSRREAGAGV